MRNTKTSFLQTIGLAILLGIASFTNIYAGQKSDFNINSVYSDKFPKIEYLNQYGSFFSDLSQGDFFVNEITQNFNSIFLLNKEHSFELIKEFSDHLGMLHYVYQHKYKNIDVNGGLVLLHTKNNKVQSMNGQVSNIKDLNVTFTLSENDIKKIAQADFYTTKNVRISEISQVIYKKILREEVQFFTAAKIEYSSLLPLKNYIYYIDGTTGKILSIENKTYHADVPSTSATYYRGNQDITVDSFNNQFRLKDNARNIHTYNGSALNGSAFVSGLLDGATEYMNSISNFTSNATKAPVEIHWGMTKVHDYYFNIHNRDSYDGNGSIVRNYYNPPLFMMSSNNAAAIDMQGIVGMVYGMGDDVVMNPVVGLDVAGHEFSHLVISRNGLGGLNYEGESGALNESFADMFATAIEFYVNLAPNWTIGENIIKEAPFFMRDMSNPNNSRSNSSGVGKQPDTYQGTYWHDPTDTSFDYGGVHINSGVGNKWFYLLCEGGTGTNDVNNTYYVSPIGISKAEKIAYRALTTYLSPTATYIDARAATIAAAFDLYSQTEADAVAAAWYAVNVGNTPTASVSEEEFKQGVVVYPNPVEGSFVNIDVALTENSVVEMYDLSGKLVKQTTLLNQGTNKLNISGIQSGVYILKFTIGLKKHSKKLVIK